MLTLDIRDELNPPPRVLSIARYVVRDATGKVLREEFDFRDAPGHGLSPDEATRQAMALDIFRKSA